MSHTSVSTSRRSVLQRAAITGALSTGPAAGLVVAGAEQADARSKRRAERRRAKRRRANRRRFKPRRFKGAPLLNSADRHVVNRFSYGNTPALTQQVRLAGGAQEWFEQQLSPDSITDTQADALVGWWPSLTRGPLDLWKRSTSGAEGGWSVMADYQRWILIRRVVTNRPVAEMMADFWMNHFNVPVHGDATFTYRFDYDKAIRRDALGTFEDLLRTAVTHPAMGIYLDNAVSTRKQPNENLGRELLELHTVGIGNFDERDVKSSARILTGYLVDMWRSWDSRYSTEDHWTGPVAVMGFSATNHAADGRGVVEDYVRYLARHPATAQRVARKLCVRFVRDDPSPALVDALADVYLRSGTAIKPVLRALVASDEFKKSARLKVRDPSDEIVATYRVLGVEVTDPPAGNSSHAAHAILWQVGGIGAVPLDWPRPDGQPADNQSWSSPARLLASMETHWSMAGGWWPKEGISYRSPVDWLPKKRIRYNLLVDHMCQQLLGRRSNRRVLKACVQACPRHWRVRPQTAISAEHPLVRYGYYRLIATILDSPDHFTR